MGSGNMPYGNAFIVRTPKLDALHGQIIANQRQRELQNQQNAKLLDEEFSKNVSNIRDADVDELTKSYQDYKAATQAAMKVKGGVVPAQQMEILRKKAAMYKLINESKAEKEREEMDAKRYYVKPDDFNDNAPQLMTEGRKLPLSQKRTYVSKDEKGNPVTLDLTNRENLLWQDKTNWQPILQKAGGTLVQRGKPVEVALPGGLEKEVTTYKGGNDPLEYYTNIIGAMNTSRAAQSLATRYNFTPAEAQDIAIKFDALKKDPAFKNAYGDIVFPESSNATEGTRTAKLLAMVNAINNPPIAEKPVRVKDLAAITANRQQFAKEQQARAAANSLNRLYVYAGIKANQPLSPEDISKGADGLIVNHIKSAAENGGELLVDADTYEALTGKKKTTNSYITVSSDGVYKYGNKEDDGNGNLKIPTTLTPVPYELAKTKIIKEYPKISAINASGQTKPNVPKPPVNKNKWDKYKAN